MSAGGAGGRKIAKELYAMGMRNRKNGAVSDVTVRRLIQNPLYKGTAVMHKTHYDFELKKQCSCQRSSGFIMKTESLQS